MNPLAVFIICFFILIVGGITIFVVLWCADEHNRRIKELAGRMYGDAP